MLQWMPKIWDINLLFSQKTTTTAEDLSVWMLIEDQIILFFIKEPNKLVLNYESNHISISRHHDGKT